MMEYHHQREGWIPCRILRTEGILIRIEFYHANRKGGKGRVSVTKEHLRTARNAPQSPV